MAKQDKKQPEVNEQPESAETRPDDAQQVESAVEGEGPSGQLSEPSEDALAAMEEELTLARDAVLRAHLAKHRAQRVEVEKFLALTASVAPDVDVAGLAARWLDQDVDVRTGEPRPAVLTLDDRVAGLLAFALLALSLVLLPGWRQRSVPVLVFGAVVFALWRGPGWVLGEHAAVVAVAWVGLVVLLRLQARLR